MLKSNEILTLFSIIDKMNEEETRDLLLLLTDNLVFHKERQNENILCSRQAKLDFEKQFINTMSNSNSVTKE